MSETQVNRTRDTDRVVNGRNDVEENEATEENQTQEINSNSSHQQEDNLDDNREQASFIMQDIPDDEDVPLDDSLPVKEDDASPTSATSTAALIPPPKTSQEACSMIDQALGSGDMLQIRSIYEACLSTFPTSPTLWYSWAQLEYRLGNTPVLEQIFAKSLKQVFTVRLWTLYLRHVQRQARMIKKKHSDEFTPALEIGQVDPGLDMINKAFMLALDRVGQDIDSAPIWHDYLTFLKSQNPSSLYEQQQLLMRIRKGYQRALVIPMHGVEQLWHDYEQWEQEKGKLTAKKILGERSAAYQQAKVILPELHDLMLHIDRQGWPITDMPKASTFSENVQDSFTQFDPARCPVHGLVPSTSSLFLGNHQYSENYSPSPSANHWQGWQRWIEWERSNPLRAPDALVHVRVIFAFRQCLTIMRSLIDPWVLYSSYLLSKTATLSSSSYEDALTVAEQARQALPMNVLSTLLLIEILDRGSSLSSASDRVQRAKDAYETASERLVLFLLDADSFDNGSSSSSLSLSTPISLTKAQAISALNQLWVHQMDFARRHEGIAAARSVFSKARKSPFSTPELYIASARLEYHCKKDAQVATRIYELAMSRWPGSVVLALDYLQFLIGLNDETNVRALFERAIQGLNESSMAEGTNSSSTNNTSSLTSNSNTASLPLWHVFLDYEARYGADRAVLDELERRMRAEYPPSTCPCTTTQAFFALRTQRGLSWGSIWSRPTSSLEPSLLPSLIQIKGVGASSTSIMIPSSKLEPWIVPDVIMDLLFLLPPPKAEINSLPAIDVDQLMSSLSHLGTGTSSTNTQSSSNDSSVQKRASSARRQASGRNTFSEGSEGAQAIRRTRNTMSK